MGHISSSCPLFTLELRWGSSPTYGRPSPRGAGWHRRSVVVYIVRNPDKGEITNLPFLYVALDQDLVQDSQKRCRHQQRPT